VTGSADQGLLSGLLAVALRDRLGEVVIERLGRLSGGASRQTWAFDAVSVDGAGRAELVLRRDPPGRPSEPGVVRREAGAIATAAAAGLAVPEVLLRSDDPAVLGTAGMVMRRVPGETIARRILREDRFAVARQRLVGQVGAFAAGLHRLEAPADLGLLSPDQVGELRARLAEFAELGWRSEVFDLALRSLADTSPPARAPVIVHGDLRLGNLLVGEGGLNAVIDWELVHLGSPAEDLGWLCVRAWRFGGPGAAAGVGSREELLAAYQAAGGTDVGLDELRWWELLGTLRWGVICMTQAWAHLSGAYRSVELAAIGRRVAEQEWDLLRLLDPEAAAVAAARRPGPSADPRPLPAPFGRPTASELLDAVRGFLTDEVMPATGGQLAFHARVAANALAIVARELDATSAPSAPETGAALGAAGATGRAGLLASEIAARLAVANPRYFDLP
jgi:aminoglycoside phosphotransferase (APT) family kinase protein